MPFGYARDSRDMFCSSEKPPAYPQMVLHGLSIPPSFTQDGWLSDCNSLGPRLKPTHNPMSDTHTIQQFCLYQVGRLSVKQK